MYLKNQDKIAEITHLIPPNLNMFGVSADQNEKVLRKIYGLQLKKMRLMRGYTQTRVANAVNVNLIASVPYLFNQLLRMVTSS